MASNQANFWICFVVEDNLLCARERKKMLKSDRLRRGGDESIFHRYLQGQGLSASEKDRNSRNATTGGLAASRVCSTTQNERHCTWGRWNTRVGFRENAHNFTLPLQHIIDHCLAHGKFPACLKISKVIPLPEVASPGSLNDLGRTANTLIMSRTMERILIKSFVATNYEEEIEARQHGF